MWAAIAAWLTSTGITDVLNWVASWVAAQVSSAKQTSAAHTSDSDQTQQDMNKVEQLPSTPTAQEETDAANDALSHL